MFSFKLLPIVLILYLTVLQEYAMKPTAPMGKEELYEYYMNMAREMKKATESSEQMEQFNTTKFNATDEITLKNAFYNGTKHILEPEMEGGKTENEVEFKQPCRIKWSVLCLDIFVLSMIIMFVVFIQSSRRKSMIKE